MIHVYIFSVLVLAFSLTVLVLVFTKVIVSTVCRSKTKNT